MKRVAVWAAVSSRPQAEKDSIPDQLEAGRRFVALRNAELAAELVVPGESRSYPTIAEAVAGMDDASAYTRLLDLLSTRSIDLLWCRALDRLGRTDPLIAEVQWRCQQAGVLVWSEQMPPTGQAAGDLYLSAIERAGAQRELLELRRRTHFGMNARARRGRMMATSRVPFGYRAEYDGRVRVAVVDEAQAAAYRWIVEAFLSRSHTDEEIHDRMRELFPERKWPKGSVRGILRNPFPAGVVVRNARGPDGQPVRIEAQGEHEAIIDMAAWRAVQRLLDLRAEGKRPPAKTLWAGLLYCDYCGSRMYARTVPLARGVQIYYHCSGRAAKPPACDHANHVAEPLVTAAVAVHLRALYQEHAAALAGLAEPPPLDNTALLERQRQTLLQRRDRLTMLFQLDRITLAEFDAQRADIGAELAAVEADLAAARQHSADAGRRQEVAAMLAAVLPTLETRLARLDPAAGNRWLRGIFAAIRIRDKQVAAVSLA